MIGHHPSPSPLYLALVADVERRHRLRHGPMVHPAAVGGVLFPRDSNDLLEYLTEVHRQVQSLEADLYDPNRQPSPALRHAFELSWRLFTRGSGLAGAEPEHGKTDWYGFHRQRVSWWDRNFSTEQIWDATVAYEQRLAELHDAFVRFGGTPRLPRPHVGWDDENKPGAIDELLGGLGEDAGETGDSIRTGLGVVAVVGVLFGAGYLLSNLRRIGTP